MDATGVRGRYGRSLLVATGWYATVLAALTVGTLSVPQAPRTDCSAMFSCLSPAESLALAGVVWGLPALLALTVVTLVVNALVVRFVRSVVAAGTLAAAVAVAVGAVAAAALGVGS
ncbi:hypothetical protein [Micromonospora sp. NPDC126480]|uniref:hypothetical protein n=1 Tax=Micromonospora sp. NPDC126480 TaxID=3155312 RepID=UPI00331A6CC0